MFFTNKRQAAGHISLLDGSVKFINEPGDEFVQSVNKYYETLAIEVNKILQDNQQ